MFDLDMGSFSIDDNNKGKIDGYTFEVLDSGVFSINIRDTTLKITNTTYITHYLHLSPKYPYKEVPFYLLKWDGKKLNAIPNKDIFKKLTDTVLFDIKHLNSQKHKEYTSVSNEIILENLTKLSKWHKKIIMRFPFIKGINDDEKNIRQTAEFLKKLNLLEVNILPYHTMGLEKYRKLGREYPMKTLEKHTQEELDNVVSIMKSYGLKAKLYG